MTTPPPRFAQCPWCEKPLAGHMLPAHKKLWCPKRPALVKALARLEEVVLPEVSSPPPGEVLTGRRPPLPCACGCGQPVAQLREKPKRYLNTAHRETHRYEQNKGRQKEAGPALTAEEKEQLHMAPIRMSEDELRLQLEISARQVLASRWPWPGMLELLEVDGYQTPREAA